jgi:predicted regulator of Ras-like GTPase activity (Roadblock/LC7/MglB family)
MAETLTQDVAPARLLELSSDARSAVLVDAAGSPVASTEADPERGRTLAELAHELFETVDRATRDWDPDPPEQVEVQVPGGAVFASRTPRWTLAVVARRAALSSLMLWDLRAVLGELEGGPPIRRSTSVDERAAAEVPEEASAEAAAGESPVPELGRRGDDS